MATKTKKTTATKTADEEVSKVEKIETKRQLKPNDLIPCRSVTTGELTLVGLKTGVTYIWADYGDVADVEFQDLRALSAQRSRFINDPLFIIEDDDVIEEFGPKLQDLYAKIENDNLDDLFELPIDRFKAAIRIVPKGLKNSIKERALAMIKLDELYDIRKVKAIDEAFGTQLTEMFSK